MVSPPRSTPSDVRRSAWGALPTAAELYTDELHSFGARTRLNMGSAVQQLLVYQSLWAMEQRRPDGFEDHHLLAPKLGLFGVYAPDSLRYSWAVEVLTEMRQLDVPEREADVALAEWLGHGSGRGRWVRMVYCQDLQGPRTGKRRTTLQRELRNEVQQMRDSVDSSDRTDPPAA